MAGAGSSRQATHRRQVLAAASCGSPDSLVCGIPAVAGTCTLPNRGQPSEVDKPPISFHLRAHTQLIAFVSSLHSPLQIHDRRYGGTEADNFPIDQEEYLVGAGVLARGQQLPEAPEMLPYATIVEAEAALGRNLTFLEVVWFRYSSRMPDYLLYYHSILCIFVVFTLAPLPLALIELGLPASISPFKIQPKVRHPPTLFFHCYKEAMWTLILSVGSFQLTCYPVFKVPSRSIRSI
ncbi:hypothetical protein ZIOFF_036910 [Zingiber officinale]|uniref:Uncharacterized protein n=1 Tax=Zingiber officinale TaxID=94328 RepID=A0A8J5GCK2_ZINOF|nr:hypothetical protein ZIOFF_036910 [Zingiber officinale]